jgi:2-polyprenyl-3-methyl-5-hydroxy-6-metoxy-1,4-benzoquinol methylase
VLVSIICYYYLYAKRTQYAPIADTATAFNKIYADPRRPPWDTDGPTPFVHDLVQAGEIRGEVLDAGCGTGENTIYLAKQGYRVVGFDAAPAAIEKARIKAHQRGVEAAFLVADARELTAWDARFETMID